MVEVTQAAPPAKAPHATEEPWPLAVVEWIDAASDDEAWRDQDHLAAVHVQRVRTIGWIVSQDATYMSVASSCGLSDSRGWEMTNLMHIPRGCIQRVTVFNLERPAEPETAPVEPTPPVIEPAAGGEPDYDEPGTMTPEERIDTANKAWPHDGDRDESKFVLVPGDGAANGA